MNSVSESYNTDVSMEKKVVIDEMDYNIDRVMAQFMEHWDRYTDEEVYWDVEGDFRRIQATEEPLRFTATAEGDSKAVLSLEYNEEERVSAAKGKLERVWNDRIEKVLERGKKEEMI